MDDFISRQDARRIIEDINTFVSGWWYSALEQIDELPTAEKRGKWIDYCGGVKCDQCGFECDDTYYLGEANYCPNCGTRMEESDEHID